MHGQRGFVTYIQCEESELALLRERLAQWLDAHGVASELGFHVKLVAHEAAKNAVEHSEPCDRVEVRLDLDDDEVVVVVVDTNADPWELASSQRDESALHGLTLIRGLSRRVETLPADSGTALVMTLGRN
jgi:anti-sigma regulatory factor (Ser/Thr protein kinase)